MGDGLAVRGGKLGVGNQGVGNSTINVSTIEGDSRSNQTGLMHQTNMSTIASLAAKNQSSLLLNNFVTAQPSSSSYKRQQLGGPRHSGTTGLMNSSLSPVGNKEGQKKSYRSKKGSLGILGSTSLLNSSSLMHYG